MFVDRVRIKVTAGKGGRGCCSFRREKHVPRGGPDGGDGGDGGDIVVVADAQRSSLLDLRYHSHWKGKRGAHGQGSDKHGRHGERVAIRVPPGTVIRDWNTHEALGELMVDGAELVVARAGKGGKGNARFATSTNKAPRFVELGEPGEERELLVELKLIAEVGIVGLPNAGKSTLLSRISAAHPKIADYPFTTLSPNLGVAPLSDHRSLTVADIPGIIEGAAEGKGLGHDFLRHIERTKVLLFLIDTGDSEPEKTLEVLKRELNSHSPVFETRPTVLALNKADVTENRARFEEVAPALGRPYFISAVSGEGVDELLEELWGLVHRVDTEETPEEDAPAEITYEYAPPYSVEKTRDGFQVESKSVLRTLRMTDFDNEEAVEHMQRKLDKIGLFKALKRMGAEDGQSIHIGEYELEYRS